MHTLSRPPAMGAARMQGEAAMAEEPTTEPAATAEPETTTVTTDELGESGKKALEDERKQRRAADKRAKDLEKQIEDLQRQQMSDAEKAIDLARAETRSEVSREFAGKLAGAEIRAAASGRVADIDSLIEAVDASKFLNDDGDPDRDAIASWVDRIAPKAEEPKDPFVDLGQGNRPQSRGDLALGSDELLQSVLKTINK